MDIDIDYNSMLKNTVFKRVQDYYRSIGGDTVRVATFRTETAKSAIITSCRGKGINNDIASVMSSLVPIERGKVWSISDTYYGNESKGRKPVTEFVNLVNQYEDKELLEAILSIEGLISGCSSHASGVINLNEPLENCCSYMRTPSGELITAFELHQCEKVGLIKFDFLLTNAIGLIQTTMELLIKKGKMEWLGDWKSTYNKYLNPEYIDKSSEEMWDLICQNKIMNLFQFEGSNVGNQAIEKLQPRSLLELANANSLMRLMNPNGEQPLDKYVRFRDNPIEWENEMVKYGLSESDRRILHNELDNQCGVCSNQESMMEMFMNPQISDFTIPEANMVRKGVGKKDEKVLAKAQELYYKKCEELNTSQKLANYCWEVQTGYQKGLTA